MQKNTNKTRIFPMLCVDARRVFFSLLFYIFLGIAIAVPILILVMTTMMDGNVSVDPQTGKETVMEGFENVWQIIGALSSQNASPDTGAEMSMDLVSMCNINLLYFGIAVFVCLFISEDFRCGYSKNLFAIRAKRGDYVVSKILICSICGAILVLGFLIGAVLGGAIAGLPFTMNGFNVVNLVFCIISKILLISVFVSIFVTMAIIARSQAWLSMILSFGIGMLLFMMIPMLTPLDATIMNVIICAIGGILFSIGLGLIAKLLLIKRDIL